MYKYYVARFGMKSWQMIVGLLLTLLVMMTFMFTNLIDLDMIIV